MAYVQIKDNKAVVAVQGSFHLMIMKDLTDELDEALAKGCTEILFDFQKTDFIDSTGIGVVIRFYKKLGKGHVIAINQTGEVLAIFRGTRLLEELR